MLASDASLAAEWTLEPSVTARTEYNDNIQLTPQAHPSVWGYMLRPDVKFGGATETLSVVGDLGASFDRYPGHSELDIDNYHFDVRSAYRGERDSLDLDLGAVRDSTLVGELSETGVVLAYRPRNAFTVNPAWTRALSETTSIIARYGYSHVYYDDTAGTSLFGYDAHSASLGVQKRLDERRAISLAGYYSHYATDPEQTRADTYGVQAGYDHAFSETLRGSLLAGWASTRNRLSEHALVCDGPIVVGICFGTLTEVTSTRSDHDSGYTLNATLTKRWEIDTLTAQASRQLNPSGVGSLVRTDRIGVAWTKAWSPTVSSRVEAAAYRTRYLSDLVTSSDSRYYALDSRVTWRVSERWTLEGGYRHARQKYDTAPVAANGNAVYVQLGYAWPKLSVSR